MAKSSSPLARPIVRQRLSEVLVGKIHEMIVREKLGPGERLPTEQELANQFGVSRLAVREATKALGFLGILESTPRRGLTVGYNAFERVIPLLKIHPSSRNIPPNELIATRTVIETGVLPYVMERMAEHPQVYERLRSLNDEMERSTSLEQWIQRDLVFHNALLEESGLKTLVAFGELLQLFFHQFREDVTHEDWRLGVKKHRVIIDALRDGNLLLAVDNMRTHIASHTDRLTR
jgi:GntR family transcriptional repressor for pyruvate dehydrogenase complex